MSIITRYAEIDVWAVDKDGSRHGMVNYRPTVLLDAEQTRRCILYNKSNILLKLQIKGVKVDDLKIDNFSFDLVSGITECARESEGYKDYVVNARLLIDN